MPLTEYVALVSLTSEVSTRSLMQVAAALQKQVTRDFGPIWGLPATVDAFEDLSSMPNDYYPVVVFSDRDELMQRLASDIGEQPALRLHAPIFAAEALLTDAVVGPDAEPPRPTPGIDAEQLKRYLETLDPEDFGKFNP